MMGQWDKEYDSRVYNLFMSMTRVAPSQLCDKALYDFAAAAARTREHPLPQEAGDEDDI